MDQPWVDILQSRVITFVIGPDKATFAVHASTLAKLSRPLEVLLTGEFKESHEGRVDWPDVDPATFGRFIQWAYTQDYDTPEPIVIATAQPEPLMAGPIAQALPVLPNFTTVTRNCLRCNGNTIHAKDVCSVCKWMFRSRVCEVKDCADLDIFRMTCWICQSRRCYACEQPLKVEGFAPEKFCHLCNVRYICPLCESCEFNYASTCANCEAGPTRQAQIARLEKLVENFKTTAYPRPKNAVTDEYEARKNKDSTESYGNVFLCHAKLYVLGDKYLIPELKQLAFHRLHATLKRFGLYPSRMKDVAMLVKFAFENAHPDDEICDMLSLYCAAVVVGLDDEGGQGMEMLITEVPNFGLALVRKLK